MNFTLIGEPRSTNNIYRFTCRGSFPSMYMSKEGKVLKEDYQWQIKSQFRGKKILKGNIGVEIKLYFSKKGKHDIDNFNKILYDAFSGLVWVDDCQIQCALTEKCFDKKSPRIEVEVYEIV